MAGSVNKVILVGNLGADPQVEELPERRQGGQSAASPRRRAGRTATPASARKRPSGTASSIFNEGLANVAEKYLRKGSKVYIEGALQTRKWQDAQGIEKYSTEIVLQGFNGVLTMLDGAPGGRRRPRRRRIARWR